MSKRPPPPSPHADLGAQGRAALSRPVIDTEVKTRGHGRIVARAVLSEPLDVYAHEGHIDLDQLEAGHRVRKSLHSWQQPRVTAQYHTASDEGLDDEDEETTDEEREQRRANRRAIRAEAEAIVGPQCWPTVKGVCEGYWLGSQGRMDLLRRGLDALVRAWRIT